MWTRLSDVPEDVRNGSTLFHVMGIKSTSIGGTSGYGYHDNYSDAAKACDEAKKNGHIPVLFNVSHVLSAGKTAAPRHQTDTKPKPLKETEVNNHRFNVIYQPHPTLDEVTRGIKPDPIQIVPPTDIMAAHEAHARMIAARAIPKEYESKLALITINVKSGL